MVKKNPLETLCFATNNLHKVKEVAAIVEPLSIKGLQEINCFEELPETHDTLEGNSLEKALYVFRHYNIPCFADDTGLEVDALNAAPGVYSARYAGTQKSSEDNIDLLLKNLAFSNNKKARFRTVITLVGVEPTPVLFEGIIDGNIIAERRGTAGFGYDPIFIPEGYTQTFAEMPLEQKNKLSHRAIAVRKLSEYLKHNRP